MPHQQRLIERDILSRDRARCMSFLLLNGAQTLQAINYTKISEKVLIQLVEEQFIREKTSLNGLLYEINPEHWFVVSLALKHPAGDMICCRLVNLLGQLIMAKDFPGPYTKNAPTLESCILTLIEEAGRSVKQLLSIGSSTRVRATDLEASLAVPVYEGSYAKGIASYEHLFGAARFQRDFLVILINNSVTGSIFARFNSYSGSQGRAGHIGHIAVPQSMFGERSCNWCGQRTCLQSVSWEGIKHTCKLAMPDMVEELNSLGNQQVVQLLETMADQGNTKARAILEGCGEVLGSAILGLINTLNPGCVLLATEYSKYLLPPIKAELEFQFGDFPLRTVNLSILRDESLSMSGLALHPSYYASSC